MFTSICSLFNMFAFVWTHNYYYFFYKFIYFIYFWLCRVFVAVHGFSLVAVSGGYSSLQYAVFSLWWLLLLRSTALGAQASVVVARGLSSRGSWALERRLSSCGAQLCCGLVAPLHVGSSRTRERTCVPRIGRRMPNHCATREVPDT